MKDSRVESAGGALGVPCGTGDEGVEIGVVCSVGLKCLTDGGVCVGDEKSYGWGSEGGNMVADGVFGERGPYSEFVGVFIIRDRQGCKVE